MGIYYVTLVDRDFETVVLKTTNKTEAIARARDEQYYIERDKRKDYVEIRKYVEDIEDEDCTCFDYDTIGF